MASFPSPDSTKTGLLKQALSDKNDQTSNRDLVSGGKDAVPVLIELAQTSDSAYLRSVAADCLGEIGPMAKDGIPILLSMIADDTVNMVRSSAAHAIGRIGINEEAVERSLNGLLSDSDHVLRSRAAISLCRIDLANSQLALDTFEMIIRQSSNKSARRVAAEGLVECHKLRNNHDGRVIAILARSLLDNDPHNRLLGVLAIESLGSLGLETIPLLRLCLADDDMMVRAASARMLWRAEGKDDRLMFSLLEVLLSDNRDATLSALEVLSEMGPTALEAAPIVIGKLNSKNPYVREMAEVTLTRMRSQP